MEACPSSTGVVYSPLPRGIRILTYWYGFGGSPYGRIRYHATAYRYERPVNRNRLGLARSTSDSHGSSLYLGISQDGEAHKTLVNLVIRNETRVRP
jgi:hypothetical protein